MRGKHNLNYLYLFIEVTVVNLSCYIIVRLFQTEELVKEKYNQVLDLSKVIQDMLSSMPETINVSLRNEFTIDNQPVTPGDITRTSEHLLAQTKAMITEQLKIFGDGFLIDHNASSSTAPTPAPGAVTHTYNWRETFVALPPNFKFVNMKPAILWDLWFFGNKQYPVGNDTFQAIPPYRTIRSASLGDKGTKCN